MGEPCDQRQHEPDVPEEDVDNKDPDGSGWWGRSPGRRRLRRWGGITALSFLGMVALLLVNTQTSVTGIGFDSQEGVKIYRAPEPPPPPIRQAALAPDVMGGLTRARSLEEDLFGSELIAVMGQQELPVSTVTPDSRSFAVYSRAGVEERRSSLLLLRGHLTPGTDPEALLRSLLVGTGWERDDPVQVDLAGGGRGVCGEVPYREDSWGGRCYWLSGTTLGSVHVLDPGIGPVRLLTSGELADVLRAMAPDLDW